MRDPEKVHTRCDRGQVEVRETGNLGRRQRRHTKTLTLLRHVLDPSSGVLIPTPPPSPSPASPSPSSSSRVFFACILSARVFSALTYK